jgi:hypothetical protein
MIRSPLNHVRHSQVFPVEAWGARPIDIFGVGAVGSHLVLNLAKMLLYPSSLHAWDFDLVEPHNVPNTVYYNRHACLDESGRPMIAKVDALAEIVAEQVFLDYGAEIQAGNPNATVTSSRTITPHKVKVGFGEPVDLVGEVAFICVDKMEGRKRIVEYIRENNPSCEIIFELRMGDTGGRIYTIDPSSEESLSFWHSHWYEDKPEDPNVCNTDPTLPMSVALLVGRTLLQFSDWANRKFSGKSLELYSELVLGYRDFGTEQSDRFLL